MINFSCYLSYIRYSSTYAAAPRKHVHSSDLFACVALSWFGLCCFVSCIINIAPAHLRMPAHPSFCTLNVWGLIQMSVIPQLHISHLTISLLTINYSWHSPFLPQPAPRCTLSFLFSGCLLSYHCFITLSSLCPFCSKAVHLEFISLQLYADWF